MSGVLAGHLHMPSMQKPPTGHSSGEVHIGAPPEPPSEVEPPEPPLAPPVAVLPPVLVEPPVDCPPVGPGTEGVGLLSSWVQPRKPTAPRTTIDVERKLARVAVMTSDDSVS